MPVRRAEGASDGGKSPAGAARLGFFTPGETKWRRRNVASSASRLHVRGFSSSSVRAARLSHIRPEETSLTRERIHVFTAFIADINHDHEVND